MPTNPPQHPRDHTACRPTTLATACASAACMAFATSPTHALNIVLDFNASASSSPSFDTFSGTAAPTGLRRMFEFAESYYQDIFEDSHTLTINYWYADLTGTQLGLHSPVSQSGGRVNESNIRIDTNRTNGNLTNWFIDPTPDNHSEFNLNQTLWRDLSGTQRTDWYNFGTNIPDTFEVGYQGNAVGGTAASGATDMLSVVLHEVGHALGLSSGNNSTVAETVDGDFDFDSINVFGRTLAVETANDSGDDNENIAHLENTNTLMTPSIPQSRRRLPSHSDLLAMAAVHNYNQLDVPRREFYGGGNWNNDANWAGNETPGSADDAFVRDAQGPGTVITASLSGFANAANLEVSEGANVDTNAFKLDVVGEAIITGLDTDVFINPDGELEADRVEILDQAEIEMSGGILDADTILIEPDSQIESTAGGSATVQVAGRLTVNGELRASGDSLLYFNTTTPTPWDLDGTSGNGTINASNGRIWFDTGSMTDSFGSEITVGAGQFFRFDAPWTVDAAGVIDLNGGEGTAERARIVGGELTTTGSAEIEASGQAEFDNVVNLGPGAIIETVQANTNLEFNAAADLDGTELTIRTGSIVEFDAATRLTGTFDIETINNLNGTADPRLHFDAQTNYASVTINKTGSRDLIIQQTGDADFLGNNTVNADVFDMDGNLGNNTLTLGNGFNNGSLLLNVDAIDTNNNTFNGTITILGGFNQGLVINLTNPTERWTMAGTANLTGNAVFDISRMSGTRFNFDGDVNVSNSRVAIDADVDLLDNTQVNFAGSTSSLGFLGFTQITAGASFSGPGNVRALGGSELLLLDGVNLGAADLENQGTLTLLGTGSAFVDGFRQTNNGQWNVNLAGANSTLYDVLVADDEIDLDGALALSLTGGYAPTLYSTTHTILNGIFGASLTGIFDQVLGVVQDGFGLAVLYTAQDIRVRAALLGDANLNGSVEQADLDAILANWGQSNFAGGSVTWINGDLNGNGSVEQGDLDLVLGNWGSVNAPDFRGMAIPEPSTAAAMLGLSLLARRRRAA